MDIFGDLKYGFSTLFTDRWWWLKVLFGGFLLINPLLIIYAPLAFRTEPDQLAVSIFFGALIFNILSFWFPLGFTYEVLRRARFGSGPQLPSWGLQHWKNYLVEGGVKLVLAITTLLLPVAIWMVLCYLFLEVVGLPASLLSMMYPPAMLFAIPFCGVACSRWLDGASVLDCALNYPANFAIFARRWQEFLLASMFLMGFNTVFSSFIYTVPFMAVFGLCMVDTWFGPIYASAVGEEPVIYAPEEGKRSSPLSRGVGIVQTQSGAVSGGTTESEVIRNYIRR